MGFCLLMGLVALCVTTDAQLKSGLGTMLTRAAARLD